MSFTLWAVLKMGVWQKLIINLTIAHQAMPNRTFNTNLNSLCEISEQNSEICVSSWEWEEPIYLESSKRVCLLFFQTQKLHASLRRRIWFSWVVLRTRFRLWRKRVRWMDIHIWFVRLFYKLKLFNNSIRVIFFSRFQSSFKPGNAVEGCHVLTSGSGRPVFLLHIWTTSNSLMFYLPTLMLFILVWCSTKDSNWIWWSCCLLTTTTTS